jgi:hypothetical protein
MPAFLDSDPAEGRTRNLPSGLSNAEQPPKILIAPSLIIARLTWDFTVVG